MKELCSQLGRVYSLLLEYREIFSKPLHRNIRPGEREAALLLKDVEFFQAMQEFVSAQGFSLRSYADFDFPGIAIEECCFLLVRNPDSTPPFFGEDSAMATMSLRYGESRESRAIWFLQLWALSNYLLYTSVQRTVRELARYTEAAFTANNLVETAKDYIEKLRKDEPQNIEARRVWKMITDPKHNLQRRVNSFLQVMVDGRFLYQPKGEEIYRQTLIGAIEMSELFSRGVTPLISEQQYNELFNDIVDITVSGTEKEIEEIS